jgi:putative DNA primase/helicase
MKASNAPEIFRAAMSAAGIDYTGEICCDGKLHRFKAEGDHQRNSWYVLYEGPPAAGAFGCWKRGLKEAWCERNGSLSHADSQRVRQQWQEADAKLKAEITARQKKARRTATWIYERGRPVQSHVYLNAKNVQPFGELRESYRGELVLPLRDINGELHSLQFIAPDNRYEGERNKTFLAGGRVSGCFYVLADKAEGPLVICEGYSTGASAHEATGHAVICAMNCGNLLEVATAARELWPQREIIIAADDDQVTDGNPGLTKATAAAKRVGAKLAVPRFQDSSTKPTDFNNLQIAEGLDAVRQQIGAAQIPAETDCDTLARLAALPLLEYDRCRQMEADALGIRVATLDAEVERQRRCIGASDATLQGYAIDLPDVEPWPQPVNGADVLHEISNTFSQYLALPPGAPDAMALWAAHSHCYEAFEVTPRLNFTSPEKGCGKTTGRDVVALFVPRPLSTENLTTAVLFRMVEKLRPTVLADEYDTWLKRDEELRGLFNAGHRRGGQAFRCEGDNHEVRGFRVFGPAVLCGIGALPGTLHDRSIVIRLQRAKPDEVQKRFDSRRTDRERELCRKLARWCIDNWGRLECCDPVLPEGAFNRLADNWRPLFALSEIAGGDWPKRAAVAFNKLTQHEDLDAQGMGVMLLSDIQQIFAGTSPPSAEDESPVPIERAFSKQLIEWLCDMKDRPWPEAQRGKAISERWLARQLSRFGIHSKTLRIGEDRAKGYEREEFVDAFDRYLSGQTQFDRDSVTCQEKEIFASVTHDSLVTDENTPITEEMSRCHAPTAIAPENEGFGEPDRDAEMVIGDELGVARL